MSNSPAGSLTISGQNAHFAAATSATLKGLVAEQIGANAASNSAPGSARTFISTPLPFSATCWLPCCQAREPKAI
jgi:hypothetical protein